MILYFIIAFIVACMLGAVICGLISFFSEGEAKLVTYI